MRAQLSTLGMLLVISCISRDNQSHSMAGTYVLRYRGTTDTLRLSSEGGYTRTYIADSGPAAVDYGSWRLTAGGHIVSLFAFPDRWHATIAHGYAVVRSDTITPRPLGCEVRLAPGGKVWLDIRPEVGLRYEQISTTD